MIRWLTAPIVRAMHAELIHEHGGRPGIRDETLLVSALARPRNIRAYKSADVIQLAAAYAYGICRNHPFVDGNKRVALMAAYVFLQLNGIALNASEEDAVSVFIQLAAGSLTEKGLEKWLRANTKHG
ncbi:MAG: type II toxin-antitoxin system death-on-curing family toxin [Candidatus Hydrogenedentes bacterium]|nr:type II toxin-antitoxin system death-on-curing family toxin [Candidatus Hydrogenedentota bacterium]